MFLLAPVCSRIPIDIERSKASDFAPIKIEYEGTKILSMTTIDENVQYNCYISVCAGKPNENLYNDWEEFSFVFS